MQAFDLRPGYLTGESRQRRRLRFMGYPATVFLIVVFSHRIVFIQGHLMRMAHSGQGFTQGSILDPQQKYVRRISYMIYAAIFETGTRGVRQSLFITNTVIALL
jgi:hypothetical protein